MSEYLQYEAEIKFEFRAMNCTAGIICRYPQNCHYGLFPFVRIKSFRRKLSKWNSIKINFNLQLCVTKMFFNSLTTQK